MAREVGRLRASGVPRRRTSFGLDDRHHPLAEQAHRAVGRARIREIADRDVDVAAAEVDQAIVGRDVDLDLRMPRAEDASRGITHSDANETVVDTVRPGSRDARRARRRPPSASAPSAAVTSRWNAAPAGVSASARCLRSNSGTPSASSSACTWRESADCVTNSLLRRARERQEPAGRFETREEVQRRQPPQRLMHACKSCEAFAKTV